MRQARAQAVAERAELPTDVMTRSTFCSLAGITPRMFEGWVAGGIPIAQRSTGRGGEWWISPSQVLQWFWAHRSKAKTPALELDAERAQLARLQAEGVALRNAQLRGELLPAEEVVAGWQAATGRARSLLLGIPTASAATLVLLARSRDADEAQNDVREHLVKLIDHALNELANTAVEDEEDEVAPV